MTFLFRTDAGPAIGTGHAMRCLALAQAMRDAGDAVTFVSASLTPSIGKKFADEGVRMIPLVAEPYGEKDALETAEHAKEVGAQWIILDGYGFTGVYQDTLKKHGLSVLFIDDYGHADHYSADLVLNQNVSARGEWYAKKDPRTRLLLGPQYTLLRREFREWKDRRSPKMGNVCRLLVTLGGSDPLNVTEKVRRAIAMTDFSGTVSVIIGSGNVHRQSLEHAAASLRTTVEFAVDAHDMPQRMHDADLAVSAAGITAGELLFMGVPFITGAFAENQRSVAETLGKNGLAENAGWYPDVSLEELARHLARCIDDVGWRSKHSRRGIAIIDGDGVLRVLQAMRSSASLTLRPAIMDDARMLLAWANDPKTRASAFSSAQIPWDEHSAWITKALNDPACMLFIGMDEQGKPVGQIRFNVSGDEADVDVHLAPEERGKGYGQALIVEGVKTLFQTTRIYTVHAFVKMGNDASKNAFLKAGFAMQGMDHLHGEEVYHLLFRKP